MSKQTAYDKLAVLGVEVDAISNREAIDYLCTRASSKQPACYVVKPYVEFFDVAYRNPALRELLNNAELSLADGVAITWATAYLYAGKRNLIRFFTTLSQIVLAPQALRWPLPDRTAGINFSWPLLETAARQKLRVFLIGSPKDGTIDHTAQAILAKLPDLQIVGTASGRDDSEKPGRVSSGWLEQTSLQVGQAQADLILVGAGFPLQENICAYLASHNAHGVFIGEGGTFDYELFGGRRPKAPAAMQRVGLEWLWRLIQEPSRFGRQLAIPRFIWRIWQNK